RALVVGDQTEAQVDIQLAAVAVRRARRQHAIGIFGSARVDRSLETFPMGAAEALGDDQVEARTERLGGRVAEDPLGAAIPEPDDSAPVGENDGIGRLSDDRPRQRRGRLLRHRRRFVRLLDPWCQYTRSACLSGSGRRWPKPPDPVVPALLPAAALSAAKAGPSPTCASPRSGSAVR